MCAVLDAFVLVVWSFECLCLCVFVRKFVQFVSILIGGNLIMRAHKSRELWHNRLQLYCFIIILSVSSGDIVCLIHPASSFFNSTANNSL